MATRLAGVPAAERLYSGSFGSGASTSHGEDDAFCSSQPAPPLVAAVRRGWRAGNLAEGRTGGDVGHVARGEDEGDVGHVAPMSCMMY
nr:hypothetical protein fge_3_PS366H01_c1_11047 [Paspalum simplex]